jgi:hypothetical protein
MSMSLASTAMPIWVAQLYNPSESTCKKLPKEYYQLFDRMSVGLSGLRAKSPEQFGEHSNHADQGEQVSFSKASEWDHVIQRVQQSAVLAVLF